MSNLDSIRKKQYDREESTYEEKEYILSKSKGKCCHCGCTLKIGQNFSRDHYIPLNKGGTNDLVNLFALCKDCNGKKTDYVIHPYDYYNYLEDTYMEELLELYKGYIKDIRWQNLKNFTREDVKVFEYKREVDLITEINGKFNNKRVKNTTVLLKALMQKLTEEEIDIAVEYLKKYNSKYNYNVDTKFLRELLVGIMEEGCIYKVHRNNEIIALIPIGIQKVIVEGTPYYVINIPGLICNYQKMQYLVLLQQCMNYILRGLSILDADNIVVWLLSIPSEDYFASDIAYPYRTESYRLKSPDDEFKTLIVTDFSKVDKLIENHTINLDSGMHFNKYPKSDISKLTGYLRRSTKTLKRKFKLGSLKSEEEIEKKKRNEKQRNRLRKQHEKEYDIKEYM